jgi:hypothetical protein
MDISTLMAYESGSFSKQLFTSRWRTRALENFTLLKRLLGLGIGFLSESNPDCDSAAEADDFLISANIGNASPGGKLIGLSSWPWP